ncbi:SMODS-associated NUDIX domain-containing protein [Enterococcus casseliflavus]|uniref:SMODS-associated NUDIX domain-containing protein n=1 Tax=Enterococcus casseliflavus TaxID=37734 RepID=UPI0035C99F25
MKEFKYIKTWGKALIYIVFLLLSIIGIFYFDRFDNSIGFNFSFTIFGLLIGYLFILIKELLDNTNWKSSQRKLQKKGDIQEDSEIRISFAYLFRIIVDGKYFLVLNNKSSKYQPVGGAYKLKKEESQYLSEKLPVENDDKIPIDETTKGDYRLYVKNKDLRKFVKRFDKTQHRECIDNLGREFKEELFSTNILDQHSFGDLKYKYCGRHMTDVQFSSYFDCYELLLADIVEVILNDEQEQLFRDLMKKSDKRYMFATFHEIRTGGVKYGTNSLEDNIANHTPKILSENTDTLINRNRHKGLIKITF